MSCDWLQSWEKVKDRAPFDELEFAYGLSEYQQFPTPEQLNQLLEQHQNDSPVLMTNNQALEQSGDYYESFIAKYGKVPTREMSWHDFFNAMIWLSFPKSKAKLNQLHIEHINRFGVSPRTPRRNRLTHFDECGVILACTDSTVPKLLAQHRWNEAFITHRQQWGKSIQAMVFGHANFEMLMSPFIGLTGKWLAIVVARDFFEMDGAQQRRQIDQQLSEMISKEQIFDQAGTLKPLPLLGVPGWWPDNQQPSFYDNQDYFRPKRSSR